MKTRALTMMTMMTIIVDVDDDNGYDDNNCG